MALSSADGLKRARWRIGFAVPNASPTNDFFALSYSTALVPPRTHTFKVALGWGGLPEGIKTPTHHLSFNSHTATVVHAGVDTFKAFIRCIGLAKFIETPAIDKPRGIQPAGM
jgi:hypothetical protein